LHHERVSFGMRWRVARPGCGCGRPGCDGCALTPRTVFVLQSELAWLVDLAADDIRSLGAGTVSVEETVFAQLPSATSRWAATMPMWLERFRHCIGSYVARLGEPGPVDPQTLAEEVALRMAFVTARAEADPDGLLPPDVADALPALPGDYAWIRAEQAIAFSENLLRLYDEPALASRGSALYPDAWFDPA